MNSAEYANAPTGDNGDDEQKSVKNRVLMSRVPTIKIVMNKQKLYPMNKKPVINLDHSINNVAVSNHMSEYKNYLFFTRRTS